jgi:hypothetical protein
MSPPNYQAPPKVIALGNKLCSNPQGFCLAIIIIIIALPSANYKTSFPKSVYLSPK